MLAAFIFAATALPQASPEKQRITARFEEIAPAPGGKPGFRCHGTADYPDGCRIDITLYYDKRIEEKIITRESAPVKQGAFSHEIYMYGEKNLAGMYQVRVSFIPALQATDRARLPAADAETSLQVGDAAAAKRDRAAFCARLSEELRAVKRLADEVLAQVAKPKGAVDRKAWKTLTEDWEKRFAEIEKRALACAEYRVLDLSTIVNGFESLHEILLDMALFAARGDQAGLRDSKIKLERAIINHLAELAPPPPNVGKLLREQAAGARQIVGEVLKITDEDALAKAKRKFVEATILLDRYGPEDRKDAIRQIAADGFALFEAVEYKTDERTQIHARLDGKIAKLQESLQAIKDEDK